MSRQKIYKTGIFKKGKKNPRRGGDETAKSRLKKYR